MNELIKQISSIDLNITKNINVYINDKDKIEYIKKNLIILGYNNKLGKNSLNILIENGNYNIIKELIELDYKILNFKNLSEKNLLQSLLVIDDLYKYLLELLIFLNKKDKIFFDKVILEKDIFNNNFIDTLILLLKKNENIKENNFLIINNLILILKLIFHIDNYSNLILNNLCLELDNDDYILRILKILEIDNIDITKVLDNNLCIDFLYYKKNTKSFKYIINKAEYIRFINSDNNTIFSLLDSINIDNELLKIIMEIIYKSNIQELRDLNNNSIILLLLIKFNLDDDIVYNLVKDLDNKIILDKNINNISIFDLIKNKNKNIIKKIKIKTEEKFNYKKIKNMLCCKTNIGIFNSDTLHNMIYTTMILEKYNDKITICSIEKNKTKIINDKFKLETCNNDKDLISLVYIYIKYFYNFYCHLIIWKDENNYFIDDLLIEFLINNCNNNYKKRFIYIKLSIIISDKNVRHANLLLIDNKNKLIERFEPYGEIYNESTIGIDNLLKEKIGKLINYQYNFIQPFPGFQSRSDELNLDYKSYGDPGGYCLAWCYLFLETRLLYDNLNSLDIIRLLNSYILNKFSDDFKEINLDTQNNKYLIFIRYYGKNLDEYKNNLIKKFKFSLNTIYHVNLNNKNYNKLCNDIIKNIEKILE
jgi:hypothetical protein